MKLSLQSLWVRGEVENLPLSAIMDEVHETNQVIEADAEDEIRSLSLCRLEATC